MKIKTFRFTVRGTYPFPTDMLRYDQAYPRSEQDSYKIRDSISRELEGPIDIELAVKIVDRRFWEPTNARWESFGWTVVKTEEVV